MARKSIITFLKIFSIVVNEIQLIQSSNPRNEIINHESWEYLDEECGVSNSDKIIGGVDASLGQYPWMVLLGYEEENDDISFLCGGALINRWNVLTAAHCILTNDVSLKFVRLGEHNLDNYIDCVGEVCAKPVQDIPISKVIQNKNYDNPHFSNDIAVLHLSRKAIYNGWVSSICLPRAPMKNVHSGIAEVAGWGIKSMDTMRQATILQSLKVPILKSKICSRMYRKIEINHRNLCVGGQIGHDSCGGDSGGPLMKVFETGDIPKYYLIGIVSFGPSKCGSLAPGVYVKVESYMEWILNNIQRKR